MFGVDERANATAPLRLGNHVKTKRGFAGRLRSEHLDDPAPRNPSDAERSVQRNRSGGDNLHNLDRALAQLHHGAFTVLFFDLLNSVFQRLCFCLFFVGHKCLRCFLLLAEHYHFFDWRCKNTHEICNSGIIG